VNCPACTAPMENPNPNRPDWWLCPNETCCVAGTATQLAARRRGITRAEVEDCLAEDQRKGRKTPGSGKTRPALKKEREDWLAGIVCPGCWKHDCLFEAVPPNHQHTGHYACKLCTWSGPGKALHPERTEQDAAKAQVTDRWGTATDKDVAAAITEERRRGKKGGGSSNGTGKAKEKKNVRFRPDRDENVWVNLRALNPLENIVRLPGVERPNDSMRKAVGQYIEDQRKRGEA